MSAETVTEKGPSLDVQDEDVYPLHAFDNAKINHKLLSWVMRFNDVLDVKKLHDSLSRLLEIGDWRKLGGRLRLTESGRLELHVPKQFSAEHPAVSFSHVTDFSGMPIEEHPLASRFPKPTVEPSTQPVFGFRPFLAPSDYPKTLEEMIGRDLPQISLHITSFSNATLVAVAWPHTLMDAVGQQDLLRSWSFVLAGREEDVPPLLGARDDILKELEDEESEENREPLAIERHRLGKIGFLAMIARLLWERLWGPPLEMRAIYLPRKIFSRLQREAENQMDELPKDADQTNFISEGDILFAWLAQTVGLSKPGPRPLTIVSFFNARYRLPRLRNELSGVYVQNMTQLSFTLVPSKLVKAPVGHLAVQHRRQLAEQSSKQQTLSLLRTFRQKIETEQLKSTVYGQSNALPMFCNNLTKLHLLRAADFGPAVLSRGECSCKETRRLNPPGTMVMYYNQPVEDDLGPLDSFYMLGKDYGDNYWLLGNFQAQTWTKLEQDLQRLKEPESVPLHAQLETAPRHSRPRSMLSWFTLATIVQYQASGYRG
ncbi:alpha-1,2-mannosidase family protein [Ophiocordyceps camponoti-floridani]|uniref:Alpha-1,2-mannosidase family protein n=1 Tax=Ophiocordyceps camponoti-floridani TaxID=2030778 RepID=A0A8H4QEC4_9HYPO|nr:alpha-1,2-mannosidase family protein [Ophiocordyceps camponoti-floridani]